MARITRAVAAGTTRLASRRNCNRHELVGRTRDGTVGSGDAVGIERQRLRTADRTRRETTSGFIAELGQEVVDETVRDEDKGHRSVHAASVLVKEELHAFLLQHIGHVCAGADRELRLQRQVARVATVVFGDEVAVSMGSASGREEALVLSALNGPLQLGHVVRVRERLLASSEAEVLVRHVIVGVEETGTTEWRLLHDRRIAELGGESVLALDGCIADLGALVGLVTDPAFAFNVVKNGKHAVDVGEVDKGIADIASSLEVNAEVNEVVGAEADVVKHLLQRQLVHVSDGGRATGSLDTYPVKLVGNVAQHDGSANIGAIKNAVTADTIVRVVDVATVKVNQRSKTELGEATTIIDAWLAAMR